MSEHPTNEQVQSTLRTLFETKPLYVKVKTMLPYYFSQAIPEQIELYCKTCKTSRPFKYPRGMGGGGAGIPPPPRSKTGDFYAEYVCSGCAQERITYFLFASFDIADEDSRWCEGYVMKIGQHPMWLPTISKDLREAFGEDVTLYEKALRNMNEGYGIGACAYFRRLIEKYVNPLLQLLHDVKEEQGESQEKLNEIKEVIRAKDFARKTTFAADIAPAEILVHGHNPLREIHERLSVGLHTLDDDEAIEYAIVIRRALEFIIPRLKREYEERKEYAETLKSIRTLST